jgi:hypothetical protein
MKLEEYLSSVSASENFDLAYVRFERVWSPVEGEVQEAKSSRTWLAPLR